MKPFLDKQRQILISPSKQQMGKALVEKLWDSFQPGSAYTALNAFLLGLSPPKIEPKQFANGAALMEWAGHLPEGQVPEVGLLSELGVLWAILGRLHDRADLKIAALKIANWQLNLLDHRGFPFAGIWTKGDFSLPHLLACNDLLFRLDHRFAKAAELQRQYLKGWDVPDYLRRLSEFEIPREKYPFSLISEEMTLGMIRFAMRDWSAVFSVSGFNSGMGAIHKNHVAIATFGPQAGVLDDLGRFGIIRPCSMKERSFQDIVWEKSLHGGTLKGWTKAHGLPLWMETAFTVSGKQAKIDLRLQDEGLKEKFNFVFYVRAQKASVGKIDIQACSLDRYSGPAAAVEFIGENETLVVDPRQAGHMELIPLAGGDFFWNTDFLLSFTIEKKVNFCFVAS